MEKNLDKILKAQQYKVDSDVVYKVTFDFDYGGMFTKWWNEVQNIVDPSHFAGYNVSSTRLFPVNSTPDIKSDANVLWDQYKRFILQQIYILFNQQVTLKRMWVNEYLPGAFVNLHNHPDSTVVSSGYVSVDSNDVSSSLLILSPLTQEYIEIPVQTNDVLIFSGRLKHKVHPNGSNKNRYVVASNYTFLSKNNHI